jgi:hypothetical protein
VETSMARFEAWLERERPKLEREVVRESQYLGELATEIHQRIRPVASEGKSGK